MNSVEVIIYRSSFERERYTFYLENEFHLWLDSYGIELRKTTRHKWKTLDCYIRLDPRISNITENQVILTDDIKERAKKILIEQIQIAKWSERK
jgi:hypothetical protein